MKKPLRLIFMDHFRFCNHCYVVLKTLGAGSRPVSLLWITYSQKAFNVQTEAREVTS